MFFGDVRFSARMVSSGRGVGGKVNLPPHIVPTRTTLSADYDPPTSGRVGLHLPRKPAWKMKGAILGGLTDPTPGGSRPPRNPHRPPLGPPRTPGRPRDLPQGSQRVPAAHGRSPGDSWDPRRSPTVPRSSPEMEILRK